MTEVQHMPPDMTAPSEPPATPSDPSPPDTSHGPVTEALADSATETALLAPTEKKVKKIIRKKRRPARPQVDPATFKTEKPPPTGTIFNIWYNKWSGGDREDAYLSKTAAPSRCNIARDSGFTRADKIAGSYFCLFFARGLCPKGQECEYLHRLPGIHDLFNPNVDCFGRDKHSDYRDDMGGVGSFMRQNRTLYVGRIHVTDDIEEIVARHFQEWGQIDRIRVLTARGVAFITYTNEANSQFAKEAMAHQALDHSEILNVRWATVDPNPAAQKREARRIDEQAAEAIRRALPADYVAEIEGRDPEQKKRRKIEGGFGLQGYEAPDDVWYAKEKAALEAAADAQLLGGPEEQGIIEGTMDGEAGDLINGNGGDGILSSSTLAALRGYGARGAKFTSTRSPAPTVGPLVEYSSDDDSD
ncbi:putative cell cycle control protein cwf2 [Lepidopterella palustris CBS 459.81]|uniref:Pre-mRNA-splicing factor CWC2 n=1 Tax=Lepidopterella palustris CBS 459.81 TaxID=1314670 RepID=A0A8E2EFB2_9PEZI|nr:putative cell cycle control protein cwf2 [Lepidopterella palustris CBS 459.81]